MGWENVFHCEWNEFGQRVLKYYWPEAISYADITKTDFSIHRGNIDIVSGGFPCQPYSTAGLRLGKNDERHLWPQMLRAVREIQPGYVVGENVRGLVNWNGGMVFDEVQTDLESEGYEVLPFLLPAAGQNAPHGRERIWFIARHPDRATSKSPFDMEGKNGGAISEPKAKGVFQSTHNIPVGFDSLPLEERINSDPMRIGQSGQGWTERQISSTPKGNWEASWSFPNDRWPTISPFCDGVDGLSVELDGITFRKWSEETIAGGGNAVVPQVVYQIFKAIEQYETLTP